MFSRPCGKYPLANLFQQSSTGQPYALQQSRLEGSGRKGPLKANVAKKAWADMSRGFRMLSTRSSKVDTVAAAKYKNVCFDPKLMDCSNLLLARCHCVE